MHGELHEEGRVEGNEYEAGDEGVGEFVSEVDPLAPGDDGPDGYALVGGPAAVRHEHEDEGA